MIRYFRLVKFSHTIFSLPFALVGYLEGVKWIKHFSWSNLGLTVLALVLARTAAMAFNRWLDRDIDKLNPRTAGREIPSGKVSPREAIVLTIVSSFAFVVTTYFINLLAFQLSPVALFIVLGYSFTKRFTAWSHVFLGLSLSIAPAGAFIAAAENLPMYVGLLTLAVIFWVAGFDIIYALQDEAFDKKTGLYSVPAVFGKSQAVRMALLFHLFSLFVLFFFVLRIHQSFTWIGFGMFAAVVLLQHLFIWLGYDKKIHLNFGLWNGIASVMFGLAYIADFSLSWSDYISSF